MRMLLGADIGSPPRGVEHCEALPAILGAEP